MDGNDRKIINLRTGFYSGSFFILQVEYLFDKSVDKRTNVLYNTNIEQMFINSFIRIYRIREGDAYEVQ